MRRMRTDDLTAYYTVDLGASGGRTMSFQIDRKKAIRLSECYRFANHPSLIGTELHWDIARLLEEVKCGIRKCHEAFPNPESLAIDTWGTDFGLISSTGALVGLPYSYRQYTGDQVMQQVHQIIPQERLYAMTGIQFMQVNTLYQLYEIQLRHPELIRAAGRLLFMPDLLNYLLCGEAVCEYTIASTSQLLNPLTGSWEGKIFDALNLPQSLMPPLVQPGTDLGRLLPGQAADAGIPPIKVRTTASHDTASAVAAVPAMDDGQPWIFISSGTWSLVGTELPSPVLTPSALQANVTNEAGVMNTTRLLKNVTGLWLFQGIIQALARENINTSYENLITAARASGPFRCFINPNDPRFHNPQNMLAAITDYCRETRQTPPQAPSEFVRCIFESLAFSYAQIIHTIRELTGISYKRIHIIGGGARNVLLNQFTANACAMEVHTGPDEATATGNGIIQAMQDGLFSSLAEARQAVRAAFPISVYSPLDVGTWQEHRSRFLEVTRFL